MSLPKLRDNHYWAIETAERGGSGYRLKIKKPVEIYEDQWVTWRGWGWFKHIIDVGSWKKVLVKSEETLYMGTVTLTDDDIHKTAKLLLVEYNDDHTQKLLEKKYLGNYPPKTL